MTNVVRNYFNSLFIISFDYLLNLHYLLMNEPLKTLEGKQMADWESPCYYQVGKLNESACYI